MPPRLPECLYPQRKRTADYFLQQGKVTSQASLTPSRDWRETFRNFDRSMLSISETAPTAFFEFRLITTTSKKTTRNDNVMDLMDKIEAMKHLSDDWNGYGSEKPSSFAVDAAMIILSSALGIRIPDRVGPSAQGGVGLFFYSGDRYADIECFNNGEILGTTAIGRERPHIWPIKPNDFSATLQDIKNFLNA
jgi:hypothetical protein